MTVALVSNKMTKQEDELLSSLLKDKSKSIKVFIPDDADAAEVLGGIRSCCSMIGRTERTATYLKITLGRLMVLARKNEEVWKLAGCKNFEDFSRKEVADKFGLSRPSVYKFAKIMRQIPDISIKEYGEIGSEKLDLVAKYSSPTDTSQKKLLDKAKELTYERLRTFLEDRFSDQGGNTGATLTITGSKAQIKELKKFLDRDDIRAAAETSEAIGIILAMTAEVESEWCERGAQTIKEEAASAGE